MLLEELQELMGLTVGGRWFQLTACQLPVPVKLTMLRALMAGSSYFETIESQLGIPEKLPDLKDLIFEQNLSEQSARWSLVLEKLMEWIGLKEGRGSAYMLMTHVRILELVTGTAGRGSFQLCVHVLLALVQLQELMHLETGMD